MGSLRIRATEECFEVVQAHLDCLGAVTDKGQAQEKGLAGQCRLCVQCPRVRNRTVPNPAHGVRGARRCRRYSRECRQSGASRRGSQPRRCGRPDQLRSTCLDGGPISIVRCDAVCHRWHAGTGVKCFGREELNPFQGPRGLSSPGWCAYGQRDTRNALR